MAAPFAPLRGCLSRSVRRLRRSLGLHPGSFKRGVFRCYLPIAGASFAALWYYRACFSEQVVLGGLGATVAFMFSLQKQKAEELKLFADLFARFNARYDKLKKKMNKIRGAAGEGLKDQEKLNDDEKDTLFQYFNLCGEEYLFYEEGFIHPAAWKAWKAGMRTFYKSDRIGDLWRTELKSGSYYELTAEELEYKDD